MTAVALEMPLRACIAYEWDVTPDTFPYMPTVTALEDAIMTTSIVDEDYVLSLVEISLHEVQKYLCQERCDTGVFAQINRVDASGHVYRRYEALL